MSSARYPVAAAAGMRRQTARGTIINSVFHIGLTGLMLARRLIVAGFLTAVEFGIWGLLLMIVTTVLFLKNIGISDRFVQQSEPDQEKAFQKAFTIDLALGVLATALAMAAVPLFAAVYSRPEVVAPGLVLCTVFIGNSLQAPAWIFYREMDFVRERVISMADPVSAFVVTVVLAISGAGYWSLVIGAVVGSFAGGVVALAASPYRVRLHLPKGTVRDYFSFSWPLVIASGGGILTGQLTVIVASHSLGLAAVGAIGLASAITAFADGVDAVVTRTIYPAICAVADRRDLLFETFLKSNRLALMWGAPFGVCVTLFAPDLVHFVIGDRWEPAIVVIQACGLVAALVQIAFNLPAFLRAINRTKSIAVLAVANVAAFLAFPAPALLLWGLKGYAGGLMAATVITLSARTIVLKRVFPAFRFIEYAVRAFLPLLPAAMAMLVLRTLESGPRTPALAVMEFGLYWTAVAGATAFTERRLLGELLGYVRGRPAGIVASR